MTEIVAWVQNVPWWAAIAAFGAGIGAGMLFGHRIKKVRVVDRVVIQKPARGTSGFSDRIVQRVKQKVEAQNVQ